MNITITDVLNNEVTISGQKVAREYAENIMLPILIDQCGANNERQFAVVKVFEEAGLSLEAIPAVARKYRGYVQAQAQALAQRQQEARQHAERFAAYNQSPREIQAKKKAREAREAEIRAHGERIRAASRGNAGSSFGFGW